MSNWDYVFSLVQHVLTGFERFIISDIYSSTQKISLPSCYESCRVSYNRYESNAF